MRPIPTIRSPRSRISGALERDSPRASHGLGSPRGCPRVRDTPPPPPPRLRSPLATRRRGRALLHQESSRGCTSTRKPRSTFSCDIAYSDSPAASRASDVVRGRPRPGHLAAAHRNDRPKTSSSTVTPPRNPCAFVQPVTSTRSSFDRCFCPVEAHFPLSRRTSSVQLASHSREALRPPSFHHLDERQRNIFGVGQRAALSCVGRPRPAPRPPRMHAARSRRSPLKSPTQYPRPRR